MEASQLISLYRSDKRQQQLKQFLADNVGGHVALKSLAGSSRALVAAAISQDCKQHHLFILNDKESAAYFCNDLEKLFGERDLDYHHKHVLFFPASYKRPYDVEQKDNANMLLRAEVLHRLSTSDAQTLVVTYPQALAEKVVTQKTLVKNAVKIRKGESVTLDFLVEVLYNYKFERVDFVTEAGQFAVRGGIIDVFSFSDDYPYRIELYGDDIESIRTFDPVTQLSREKLNEITVLPNIQELHVKEGKRSVLAYFKADTIVWKEDAGSVESIIDVEFEQAEKIFATLDSTVPRTKPEENFVKGKEFFKELSYYSSVEFGHRFLPACGLAIDYKTQPQPTFNKKLELLVEHMRQNSDMGITNLILSENPKQIQRLERIFFELGSAENPVRFAPVMLSLFEGFSDPELKICCYTDHQIFERYQRFSIHTQQKAREAITLKELYDLKPGDYITHIDHGVGRFGGLEIIDINGRQQETIRLIYKENDVLNLSIHALHKIAKYTGKEGAAPTLTRLGSNTWVNLKNKTKQRVKDIAKDLIKLYAKRRDSKGFAFSSDSYLQAELEASFFYEDTPDQLKATNDVKADMESSRPMDRLVCGDVGFGKTEVAIRAAFKAAADGKQVAVLTPTTVLAFQHFKTFSERLKHLPCRVEYVNRFRKTKDVTRILKELQEGKIDILIGTHRLIGKDVHFKDLGLLIIDEEQKFGVAIKEKLKQFKVDVDTLTFTATPIPRTLQFSLMGARDMSIIATPPPNRFPVHTEIHVFDEELIRDVILHELSRGGQVFFVHSRVQNIVEIAGIIQRLIPDARIAVGHGQMEGAKLEEVMLGFIEGEYDILVATKIVENGLDIPNANTIIINEAHHYGLSELHQLRGRVGRSNRKSYCYLFTPPEYMLTEEARRRLNAIEEFSDIGSGFNIAMRDLDIRGAGDILGAEQSGFISEIGMDMYQKILDEALQELKETEFKDLYQEELLEKASIAAKDCVLETDLELLIPDTYVNNTSERFSLYKELDSLENDEQLQAFKNRLQDRFGTAPEQVDDLLETIRLRMMSRQIGLEKIVLKRNKLIGTFVGNPDAAYYQSETFTKVLQFIQRYPKLSTMKENNNKLTITFENIDSVQKAKEVLSLIVN